MGLATSLTQRLNRASRPVFVLYTSLAAFATYFCMYAFRKPFAVATFEGMTLGDSDVKLKTAFVVSQIVGYALSKFLGIKVCSELPRTRRAWWLAGLVVLSEAALLLFAVAPTWLQVVAIFLNGVPLGMVWGLVVSYLEGRQTSELLLAGLSCSFIVASGAVKDVGKLLMVVGGVSESWMPFVTGLVFLGPFLGAVWLLNCVPEPDARDVEARVARVPMDAQARRSFFWQLWPGLVMLFVSYFFLTAFRDYRDNYGMEIFTELGYGEAPGIFTITELPVAFGVMIAMGALNLIRDNRLGLLGALGIMTLGTLLVMGATALLDLGVLDGAAWMILIGVGSYLTYVPFNSVLFDRMIAHTKVAGTAVFAIYLADALGYSGSIAVQLYRDLNVIEVGRLGFFRTFTYVQAMVGVAMLLGASLYFLRRDALREMVTYRLPASQKQS